MRGRSASAQAHLRASDDERAVAATALRAHCESGRIDVDELEQRLDAALAASTLGELEALFTDLPHGRPAAPAAAPRASVPAAAPVRLGGLGLRSFHQAHELPGSRERVYRQALTMIVPRMAQSGYDLVTHADPELLVFETNERPGWVPFACVLAFPFGLLSLMVRRTHRVTLTFEPVDGADPPRTRVTVAGVARRGVRRAFAALGEGD